MELFASLLKSRDNCLYVQTYEEDEFLKDVCDLALGTAPYKAGLKKNKTTVYTYSRFEGLERIDPQNPFVYDTREQIKEVTNIPKLFGYIQSAQNQVDMVDDYNGFRDAITQSEDPVEKKEEDIEKVSIFILKDLKPLVTSIMSMRSESLMMSLVSAVSGLSSYASQATSYRWSLIIALILGLVICAIVVIGLLQEQGTFFISHFFDFFGYYSKEK